MATTNSHREVAKSAGAALNGVAHGDLRAIVAESILKDILGGKFAPGQRLVTEMLAQRFEVSHTPIREAISTLEGIGVLKVVPNRGAIVRSLNPQDIREIMYVRAALEAEAIESACGRIPGKELLVLKKVFIRLAKITGKVSPSSVRETKKADTELHTLVRQHTANRFLSGELDRLMPLVKVIRDQAWSRLTAAADLRRVAEESAEHLEIVEALLRNEPLSASRAMRRHLRNGAEYVSRAAKEADQS